MQGIRKRTWAEINLDHAAWNYHQIRKAVRPETKVCCVIKANGYGHNAVRLAALYESLGADFLAVSNLEEALQLRQGQITLPILILGYTPPECAGVLAKQNIAQCVYSRSYGESLSQAAMSDGVRVKMHIKIDTGMGRIGFQHRGGHSELSDALAVCKLPCLKPEGIFTHFAVADDGTDGESFTLEQYRNFIDAINTLGSHGIQFALRHCANSAAILRFPEMSMDMVRAGIILYGLHPSDVTKNLKVDLRPAMTLKARITLVKSVPKGTYLSYGSTYKTERESVIATVPIGYADGYMRNLSNRAYMLIGGQKVPVRGRVCMDQCMADITDLMTSVKAGDEAVIFGCQNGTEISADELARTAGTINYELVCVIGKRVPRIYIKNGRIANVLNYLIGE